MANLNQDGMLIDKDGTIYQTASLNKRCFHISYKNPGEAKSATW